MNNLKNISTLNIPPSLLKALEHQRKVMESPGMKSIIRMSNQIQRDMAPMIKQIQEINNLYRGHLETLNFPQLEHVHQIAKQARLLKKYQFDIAQSIIPHFNISSELAKEIAQIQRIFQKIPENDIAEIIRSFNQSLTEVDSEEYDNLNFSLASETYEDTEVTETVKKVLEYNDSGKKIELSDKQISAIFGFLLYFLVWFHQEEIEEFWKRVEPLRISLRQSNYGNKYLELCQAMLDAVLEKREEQQPFETRKFLENDCHLELNIFDDEEN